MKLKLNTGICQIINVDMYESILSPSTIFDRDVVEIIKSKLLTDEEKDYFIEHIDCDKDAYNKIVANYAIDIISDFFVSINDTIQINLCENGTINSPPYYNFRSDELDFEVEINMGQLKKIYNWAKGNQHFFQWASRYKSCSGFISHMPYTETAYLQAIQGKDFERALSMYLTYLYEDSHDFGKDEFGHTYALYEKIISNHSIVEFITNKKSIEIYEKAYAIPA